MRAFDLMRLSGGMTLRAITEQSGVVRNRSTRACATACRHDVTNVLFVGERGGSRLGSGRPAPASSPAQVTRTLAGITASMKVDVMGCPSAYHPPCNGASSFEGIHALFWHGGYLAAAELLEHIRIGLAFFSKHLVRE